jgi:hypothetical protein
LPATAYCQRQRTVISVRIRSKRPVKSAGEIEMQGSCFPFNFHEVFSASFMKRSMDNGQDRSSDEAQVGRAVWKLRPALQAIQDEVTS